MGRKRRGVEEGGNVEGVGKVAYSEAEELFDVARLVLLFVESVWCGCGCGCGFHLGGGVGPRLCEFTEPVRVELRWR